ncbi:MAG: NAD(P)/FAD-dependent oxidoreductase [Anaerolineae bacterium]|nr:NAD(P)/FAD-dependent oxidoreductase [Anaerolineae bacterium]
MGDNSVIIVGAGLAGLAAGCYAQMNGYDSHIFEHHTQPGGVAAAWRRNGYLIDGGIHFVMGHKPGTALYEVYRQLGIVPANRFVDLTTYGRFVDEASGLSIEVTADLDRLATDLKALSPADARTIDELTAGARAMQGLDMSEVGLSKPPELSGRLDQVKDLWAMRRLWRYFTGKYARPVADYTRDLQDPFVCRFIENLFLPQAPVFFIQMLLGLLADGQIGLIEGGCHDFVTAIERRYLALGGQVTYRAKVQQILVESGRAVGVRLANTPEGEGGSEHRAGAVIAACDGRSAIFDMLGGRYLNDKIEQRYAAWPTFRPLLTASFGVTREFPGEPTFTTITLKQPLTIGSQPVKGIFVRIFNYSARFAPPGKSVIQAEIETEWDYWNDLQQTGRAVYEAEKERAAAELLHRLEMCYPDLAAQVEVTDVATPYTTWRYTLNYQGAWEGWLMTAKTMMTAVERTLPGLADFYMAGQWVMPGGGVPPCLYSGRHAVQLLCRRDRRRFTEAHID